MIRIHFEGEQNPVRAPQAIVLNPYGDDSTNPYAAQTVGVVAAFILGTGANPNNLATLNRGFSLILRNTSTLGQIIAIGNGDNMVTIATGLLLYPGEERQWNLPVQTRMSAIADAAAAVLRVYPLKGV